MEIEGKSHALLKHISSRVTTVAVEKQYVLNIRSACL
jgi:hypothetical protein